MAEVGAVVLLQALADTVSVRSVGKECPINGERLAMCSAALSAELP